MRITALEKTETRRRILETSVQLFRSRGFDATTTRDIATAAEIATGTLFNYFDTKEAVAVTLAEESLAKARANFARDADVGTFEEQLFSLIAAELRQLKPLRSCIAPLLETALSPLAASAQSDAASFRGAHLEIVADIARRAQKGELSAVAIQLYWTLYTGVLAFWANDKSPKQEDTLALLDQSLAMFAGWLDAQAAEST